MTKRYNLTLTVKTDDGSYLIDIDVRRKTMETIQQLVRLSMSDFEKVDPAPLKRRKWGGVKGGRIDPPIEPIETVDGPTDAELAQLNEELK